jgi:hypothetical protein
MQFSNRDIALAPWCSAARLRGDRFLYLNILVLITVAGLLFVTARWLFRCMADRQQEADRRAHLQRVQHVGPRIRTPGGDARIQRLAGRMRRYGAVDDHRADNAEQHFLDRVMAVSKIVSGSNMFGMPMTAAVMPAIRKM